MAEYPNISTSCELRKAILNKIKAINTAREREMKKEVPLFCFAIAQNLPELHNYTSDYERLYYKISNLNFDIAICKEKERIIDMDFEVNRNLLLDMRENEMISEEEFKEKNKKLKAENQYNALTNDVEYYHKQIECILSKKRLDEIEEIILVSLKEKYVVIPKDKLTPAIKRLLAEVLKALSNRSVQKPIDLNELRTKLSMCEESLGQAKNYYDKLFEKDRIKEEKINYAVSAFKNSPINLTPFKDPNLDENTATLLDYRNVEELEEQRELILRLFDENIRDNIGDVEKTYYLKGCVDIAFQNFIEKSPLRRNDDKKSVQKR